MADYPRNDNDNELNRKQTNSDLSDSSQNDTDAAEGQGGTRDLNDATLVSGRRSTPIRDSGIVTKNSVTGSDFDGQVTPE